MDVAEVKDACRLCPTGGTNQQLISVFDNEKNLGKSNMREVILVTTGVEILENDVISKKICQRCLNITLKVFQFRQDAQKQDRHLKEHLNDILKETVLSKTITSAKEQLILPEVKVKIEPKVTTKETLHPSVTELYKNNPCLKVPKVCMGQHLAPVVDMKNDEVERYFRKRNLNMTDFITEAQIPSKKRLSSSPVAQQTMQKMVSPLRISKKQCESPNTDNTYFFVKNKQNEIRKANTSIPLLNEPSSSSSSSSSKRITVGDKDDALMLPPPTSKLSKPPVCRGLTTPPPPTPEEAAGPSIEFFQNFGLTPTVSTVKTTPLCACTYCGSVHYNSFELKRHTIKVHTMCQFCKKKFKSVETKQKHQDKGCEMQEILNNPGPIVSLERVELNVDIRKKFKKSFSGFEALAGSHDDVIILSDDEEAVEKRTALKSPSALEPLYTTVSIVKPSVKIKNDKTIDEIEPGLDNKKLKQLISERKPRKLTVDTAMQTDFPTKSILINNLEGTCQFSELKDYLSNYKVRVEVQNGEFNACYKFDEKPPQPKGGIVASVKWDHLPLIDVKAKSYLTKPTIESTARILASQRMFATKPSTTSTSQTVKSVPASSTLKPSNTLNSQTVKNVPTNSTLKPSTTSTSQLELSKNVPASIPLKPSVKPALQTQAAKNVPTSTTLKLSAKPALQPQAVKNVPTSTTSKPSNKPALQTSVIVTNGAVSSTATNPILQTPVTSAPVSSSSPVVLNGLNNIPTSSPPLTFRLTVPSTTPPAVVNSATPLLQSYALSMATVASPTVTRTPIPFPKRFINKTKAANTIPRLILGNSALMAPAAAGPSTPMNSKITIIGVHPPNNSSSNNNVLGGANGRNVTASVSALANNVNENNNNSFSGFRVKPLSELQ